MKRALRIFGIVFASLLPWLLSFPAYGTSLINNRSVCRLGVSLAIKSLQHGHASGTPWEQSVSLAALQGDNLILKFLFGMNPSMADPYMRQQWENNALNLAVRAGHLQTTTFLIDMGAQVNAKARSLIVGGATAKNARPPQMEKSATWPAGTPLANSVQCGRARTAQLLLDRGANMYASDTGEQPNTHGDVVVNAIISRSEKIVNVFISHHLDPCKVVVAGGLTLQQLAAREGFPLSVQRSLSCPNNQHVH